MIGGVGDQEISNGKGEYSRQNKGDVVADEVEKCGAGGAGNGMVVFRGFHVVVYPSCFLKMTDVRCQTSDFRYQMSDFRYRTFDFRLQTFDV